MWFLLGSCFIGYVLSKNKGILMENKISIKEFIKHCDFSVKCAEDYLQYKSNDQIKQLRIDLKRKRGNVDSWNSFLTFVTLIVSIMVLIINALNNRLSEYRISWIPFFILIFLLAGVYVGVIIRTNNKVKYEIAIEIIDNFLKSKIVY